MRQGIGCLAALLLIGLMTGCGPSEPRRQPVSGVVKYKGAPLKKGTINFRSEDGKYVGTGEIADGKYDIPQISGMPAGKYVVAISYPDPKIPAPKGDEPPGEWRPAREMLPAKYNDSSELKAEIKEGPNDVSYDLK
jgi:hypothetical protein